MGVKADVVVGETNFTLGCIGGICGVPVVHRSIGTAILGMVRLCAALNTMVLCCGIEITL